MHILEASNVSSDHASSAMTPHTSVSSIAVRSWCETDFACDHSVVFSCGMLAMDAYDSSLEGALVEGDSSHLLHVLLQVAKRHLQRLQLLHCFRNLRVQLTCGFLQHACLFVRALGCQQHATKLACWTGASCELTTTAARCIMGTPLAACIVSDVLRAWSMPWLSFWPSLRP
jgi:hypothetical protein